MTPTFPITVTFHESGEQQVFDSIDEVACTLEWFDSDATDENASVVDSNGRRVRVKVHHLEIAVFEIQED